MGLSNSENNFSTSSKYKSSGNEADSESKEALGRKEIH